MQSQTNSCIQITTSKVISLCEKTIEQIKNHRKEEDDKFIDSFIENYHKRRWYHFKDRPKLEREEYIELIHNKIANGNLAWTSYPSIYGWGTLDVAEKLLKAAKQTNGNHYSTMYISVEDFYQIFPG